MTISLFGQKHSWRLQGLEEGVETFVLPGINTDSLRTATLAGQKAGRPLAFARAFNVDISPLNHGTWRSAGKDLSVWQLLLVSKGAYSLNLGFDQFELPPGARLFFYDPDQKRTLGPIVPADNEPHDQFWTPILPGEAMVVELQIPSARLGQLRLHLSSVNHDFLGFNQILSGSCNLDVVCGGGDGWEIVDRYRDIIRAVGAYSLNGTIICTGFLVNNARQDCSPYFLSANHCGISSANAPSMVVYWNYQNNQCRQPGSPASGQAGNGSLGQFNSGAVYKAGYASSDFALVELDDPVNPEADAFFAGWNAAVQTPTDTLICIHHPNNQEKRISFSFSDAYAANWGDDQPNPGGTHMIVPHWDIGTTEGGSSGAPLFNKSGQVVGQLHGGLAACGNQGFDSFGRFYSSWLGGNTNANALRYWLDPDNTGITQMEGRAQDQCGAYLTLVPPNGAICLGDTVSVDLELSAVFGDTTAIVLSGLPEGAQAQIPEGPFTGGAHIEIRIFGTQDVVSGQYPLTLNADDGVQSATAVFNLAFEHQPPGQPLLVSPAAGQNDVNTSLYFTWSGTGGVFELQVATDDQFENPVYFAAAVPDTVFGPIELTPETEYFWRVRADNVCGPGAWSDMGTFFTGNYSCSTFAAEDTPVGIDGGSANAAASSRLQVSNAGTIGAVTIMGLDIEHSWVGDLSAELVSPQGTVIPLFDRPGFPAGEFGCDGADILINLNDNGSSPNLLENTCNGSMPAITGDYRPLAPFSNLIGEPAAGEWILRVIDHEENDGGSIRNWTLGLCINKNNPNETIEISAPDIRIYPNPVTDILHFRMKQPFGEETSILVSDVLGREQIRSVLPAGQSGLSLETGTWLPGIYWVSIRLGTDIKTFKMIKT